jgi:hypothetical protein
LAGETEALGENLPQRHYVHQKSHLTRPGSNPGRRGVKPVTKRLSYGAASIFRFEKEFKQETSLKHIANRTVPPQRRLIHGVTFQKTGIYILDKFR